MGPEGGTFILEARAGRRQSPGLNDARATRIPIFTVEKPELVRGFRPSPDHAAADIIRPDLAFAGGITATRKIADYAVLTGAPVALHNE